MRTLRHSAIALTLGFLSLALLSPRTSSTIAADDRTKEHADHSQPDELEKLQGQWEREIRPEEKVTYKRVLKTISGNRETVTYYGENGEIQREHEVEFRLERQGPVKIFTFYNQEITAGPEKGTKVEGSRSYIYRLTDDTFDEVWGFLPDQEKRPIYYSVHRRVKGTNSLPGILGAGVKKPVGGGGGAETKQ